MAALILLLSISAECQSGSSWDAYQPRTLQSVIDQHKKAAEEDTGLDRSMPFFLLSADSFPSQVKLTYLGETRHINGRRAELLQQWKNSFHSDRQANIEDVFGTEMLFQESGGTSHWIAVQKTLVDPLPHEVKRGETFNAFVIWMGGVLEHERWEWLFAMNEFDTPLDQVETITPSLAPIECDDLPGPKRFAARKTPVLTSKGGAAQAYATIEVHGPADAKGKCSATSKLFVSQAGKPFAEAKSFSEQNQWMTGVEMIGFSPDESKLAADFWWGAGDGVEHRPVILDLVSGKVLFGELKEQITSQLPSCDYVEDFIGVTDRGEAIINVPKSHYVEEGCPDQGDWLFDVTTGTVKRQPR